jgi:hypothetical protein
MNIRHNRRETRIFCRGRWVFNTSPYYEFIFLESSDGILFSTRHLVGRHVIHRDGPYLVASSPASVINRVISRVELSSSNLNAGNWHRTWSELQGNISMTAL